MTLLRDKAIDEVELTAFIRLGILEELAKWRKRLEYSSEKVFASNKLLKLENDELRAFVFDELLAECAVRLAEEDMDSFDALGKSLPKRRFGPLVLSEGGKPKSSAV